MGTHSAQSQNVSSITPQQTAADVGLLLIRAVLAIVFIYHGGQKLFGWWGGYGIGGTAGWMASIGFPLPTLNAVLAGSAEFFGGIVLLLGTGARLAAIPMAFTMAVAVYVTSGGGFSAQTNGIEFPLTLGVVLVALGLLGAGRYTVGNAVAALRSSRNGVHPVTVAA